MLQIRGWDENQLTDTHSDSGTIFFFLSYLIILGFFFFFVIITVIIITCYVANSYIVTNKIRFSSSHQSTNKSHPKST